MAAPGVLVEQVHAGYGGDQAGLKAGDVLRGWTREASAANPSPAQGTLDSQFDFVHVEIEQAPRGPLAFHVERDGARLDVRMPRQDWVVSVGPILEGETARAYAEARALVNTPGSEEDGFARWAVLAQAFHERGRRDLVSWLQLKRARLAAWQARWETADAAFAEALAAADDTAAQAQILGFQGAAHMDRVDWEPATAALARALEIHHERGHTLHAAHVHDQLQSVAFKHGDLQAAEHHGHQAFEIRTREAPGSNALSNSLFNLGLVAAAREDLAAAEDYFQRALALDQSFAPTSANISMALYNLGAVAEKRGDLAAAEDYHKRALAFWRQYMPESLAVASGLVSLANLSLKRGRPAAARELAPLALEMAERVLPAGIVTGDAALCLGDIALAEGGFDAALGWYQRALEVRRAQLPGSSAEAEVHRRLGALARRRKRPTEARTHHLDALTLLDAQSQRLGGTDEVRARFAAQYAPYYSETIDLLMEMGLPEEAFHVAERYRARAFLALLAERDLVFAADIPPALDRERRAARAEYDRTLAALAGVSGEAALKARQTLDAIRRRQAEIDGRVRAASPRLAALEHSPPLDLAGARAALDPGTVLLSYVLGESHGYLFAVGPAPADFLAVRLDVAVPKLRDEVERYRDLIQSGGRLGAKALRASAERLSAALLAPAADRIGRADRVLILPDGALHVLPFASLADPTSPRTTRTLVEAKPLFTAASATVFASLRAERRPARPARLIAFGDPDYQAAAGAASLVRRLKERGLELVPLPASRREVETLRELYPQSSRVFLGAEASEERARAMGREASLVHFACHALADESSPLDSSLVLALPPSWKPGRPNGLLQAWEIFEQVRLDADLVTLSACGTALGRQMSGEGMLGLTRAFQYAGARSLLASLWAVSDEATAELMRGFYRRLRRGESKDAALRGAQLELIESPRFAHPSLWAAFQLSGDWR